MLKLAWCWKCVDYPVEGVKLYSHDGKEVWSEWVMDILKNLALTVAIK